MAWVNGVQVRDWSEAMYPHQHVAFDDASRLWEKLTNDGRAVTILSTSSDGLLIPRHPRYGGTQCGSVQRGSRAVGAPCVSRSGAGTAHVGVGPCRHHYGRGARWGEPPLRFDNGHRTRHVTGFYERALWSWVMAHAYAQARDTTPWQALLDEVRDLAGQVAWLNDRLMAAEKLGGADALRPDGEGWVWVVMRDQRGDRLAKTAKMAIDAGVAQYLISQVQLQGELMFKAATLAAAELALPEADQLRLVSTLARKLTELESANVEP